MRYPLSHVVLVLDAHHPLRAVRHDEGHLHLQLFRGSLVENLRDLCDLGQLDHAGVVGLPTSVGRLEELQVGVVKLQEAAVELVAGRLLHEHPGLVQHVLFGLHGAAEEQRHGPLRVLDLGHGIEEGELHEVDAVDADQVVLLLDLPRPLGLSHGAVRALHKARDDDRVGGQAFEAHEERLLLVEGHGELLARGGVVVLGLAHARVDGVVGPGQDLGEDRGPAHHLFLRVAGHGIDAVGGVQVDRVRGRVRDLRERDGLDLVQVDPARLLG